MIYRHFAWLTALRYQLREPKPWENTLNKSYNREYRKYFVVPEWEIPFEEEVKKYLSADEQTFILKRKNRAAQLIAMQSDTLRALNEQGKISDLNYVEIENVLKDLYDHQGKSERIKNFPYPRQFSSVNRYFAYALTLILPLGFLNEFCKLSDHFIWLTIPFSVLVGWIFLVLEQVGESTENPFEGGANDVSISQMSRAIEIDLRDMLGEEDLPAPLQPKNNIVL